MAIFRMYTGPDGKSHWEKQTLAEYPTLTKPQAAAHIVFNQQPAGTFLDWHPAPRRQYVIVISGQLEIGFGDGTTRRFGPGNARLGRGYDGARTYDAVCRPRPGDNGDNPVNLIGLLLSYLSLGHLSWIVWGLVVQGHPLTMARPEKLTFRVCSRDPKASFQHWWRLAHYRLSS